MTPDLLERMLDAVYPHADTWSELEAEHADRQRDKFAAELEKALTAAREAGFVMVKREPDYRLDTIIKTIQQWLDWQQEQYEEEGTPINDNTHIYNVPHWPSRGVFKKWIEVLSEYQAMLARSCEQLSVGDWGKDEAYAKGVASTKPKKPHCPKCNSDDVGLIFDPPSVVNREEDIYQCLKCKYESKDWNEWSPR